MRKRLKVIGTMTGLLFVLLAPPAHAVPLTGSFSITGNFVPVTGITGIPTTLDLATGIDFIALIGSTPTPGTPGDFLVNSASGSFRPGLLGQSGKIADFSFAGLGSAAFPTVPVSWFQTVNGVTFDLLSIAVTSQASDFLLLSGTGVFHMTGFQDTLGTFKLSAQGDDTFSFSASDRATAAAVSEPASLLLFGSGLMVVGGGLARRLRRRLSRD